MGQGSLLVVGSGIALAGHLSAEARAAIVGADIVFAQMGDALAEQWLATLNPNVVSLAPLYQGRSRLCAYALMAQTIVAPLREGRDVCAVFYGHPGVFVRPSHDAIALARRQGHAARMLAAISAEDCLFADLGLDPAQYGAQSFEARDFVLNARTFDPAAPLILWQPAVLGDDSFTHFTADARALGALREVLLETYPAAHEVVLYEAASLPIHGPRIEPLALARLAEARVGEATTLVIPPLRAPVPSQARRALLARHLIAAC